MSDGPLAQVYAALRSGDAEAAMRLLEGGEFPGAAGRDHAYRAQALARLGRPEEGARAVIDAIRAAKAEGAVDALPALRALHVEISAQVAAMRLAEAGRAADLALLTQDPAGLASEVLLRKAGAHTDAGEAGIASELTRLALERAETPRDRMLAQLALARLTRDPAWILAAHTLAESADDHNLLTAVAHAARALGVRLAPPEFG